MDFFVNGEKVDIALENEKTINDVLKAFEEEAYKNEATTIGIKINGKDIPASEFDAEVSREIQDDTRIDLKVLSKSSVIESLRQSMKNMKELSKQMLDIPSSIQSGNEKKVFETFEDLANKIDAFCHTATLSSLFPEVYSAIIIDGKNVCEFFEEFAPIMADFETSLNDKDSVTTGDLCEYEIAPRLEEIYKALESCLN